MPFPEFEPGRKRVLFFSRGRGRGHAVPDIAIFHALRAVRDDIDVRFVSYGTGAETFRAAEVPIIDLGLPDSGGIVDTSVLAGKLIHWLDPDVVVSHEEFPALPAAKIFDKRTLMLTDWFLETEGYAMNSLKFADRILFLGLHGVYQEPPALMQRVTYLGPILRSLRYGPGDREKARRELDIPAGVTVVSVLPGSWLEERTPLLYAVLDAFESIMSPRRLCWLAGADYELIRTATEGRTDVLVLRQSDEIDRLMVASDVAITKSNRKTVFELQHFGIPTIAVTFGLNPGDDIAVAALSNVVRIHGAGLTGAALGRVISELLSSPRTPSACEFCSPRDCADWISRAM